MADANDFYSQILNAANSQLVRMPDGTYRAAPQMSGPTSVEQLYQGIIPKSVSADPVGSGMADSGGWNQFDDQFNSPASIVPQVRTASQAGNVALPKGVVPKRAASDLAAITSLPGGAFTGGYGSSSILPHTAIPNQSRIGPTPSPILSFAGDEGNGPAVSAINGATSPFGGSAGGIGGSYVPSAIPLRPSSGLVPLTQFNTVNPASQIVPRVQSTFNSSPIGHVASLLSGEPVQGELLGMLFNHSSAPVSQSLAQAMATPAPISADTHAALMAQQSPDQRGQAALQASGMLDNFGMVTGSGGHSLWGSH